MGALQCTLPPDKWLEHALVLKKDRDAPPDLRERLVAMGYEPVAQVVQLGQFAVRGGILDLASPGSPSGPVRLEFFGDTLTSLRPLDILNQRSSGRLDEVLVFPAHEVVLDAEARQNLKRSLRAKVQEGESGSPARWAETALELFSRTSRFPGWQWQALGALSEPLAFERKFEELQERLKACEDRAKEEKSDLFPVQDLFSDRTFLRESLNRGRCSGISHLNQELFNRSAQASHEVPAISLAPYYGKFATFASDLKKWLSGGCQVVLWCHNRGERERLGELLREEKLLVEPAEAEKKCLRERRTTMRKCCRSRILELIPAGCYHVIDLEKENGYHE